jgi:hypothetical protein
LLKARETVVMEKPTRFAMSLIVADMDTLSSVS